MLNGEKLYVSVDGVVREYTEEEYAQAQIDYNNVLLNVLPTQIRTSRNHFLTESDWTQSSDSPLSADKKSALAKSHSMFSLIILVLYQCACFANITSNARTCYFKNIILWHKLVKQMFYIYILIVNNFILHIINHHFYLLHIIINQ